MQSRNLSARFVDESGSTRSRYLGHSPAPGLTAFCPSCLGVLMEAKLMVPAAQYVRMSREDRQYSMANQKDTIQIYARSRGYVVTATRPPNHHHLASFFFSFQRNRRASDMAARASSEIHPFGLRSPPIGRLSSREICRAASQNELSFSSRIPFLSQEWSRERITAQRFAIGGST